MTVPNGPILFNNSTGSDTAASGLGPATALFGTGASLNSTSTVDLSADTPNLSGVTAGDLLWVDTSSGRQFSIIASVDDGADTVTCDDAFGVTESGRNWGIGGKRAQLFSNADSRLLLTADLKAGWTVELESGYTDSFSGGIDLGASGPLGDTTNGVITIRGASGAATKPVVTNAGGSATQAIILRRPFWVFRDFEFVRGASGASSAITDTGSDNAVFERIDFRNWTTNGLNFNGAQDTKILECEFDACGTAINGVIQNGIITLNNIHDCTSNGIDISGVISGLTISENTIVRSGAIGITISNSRTDSFGSCHIRTNVIQGSTSDGIRYASVPNAAMGGSSIVGNIIAGSGGVGLNFSHASSTATLVAIHGTVVDRNVFYSNTSGHRSNVNAGDNDIDLTADPFVDAANDDFNINDTAGGGALLRAATLTMPG